MTLNRVRSVPGKATGPHPRVKGISHVADTAQKHQLSSWKDGNGAWKGSVGAKDGQSQKGKVSCREVATLESIS